ncbi:MAG: leucine-rich repeat domain-containing protein, partial [Lachnospiraceae bacterium]|nr:leucine-rich repeat domain-containing protein [Lachnospiraceae bacterium]
MGLKLNGKMKKRIRKAVAGVCLVSAVLVAAIPADYSGVAQAEDMMELMDYNYDSNLPRNGKLTNNDAAAPSMIRPEDESLMHKSYCIRNIESEYVLVYEYDYFTQTTSKGTVGIIAAYNNFGATSQVNLSSTITTGFKIVKTEDYNTFVLDKIVNNPELDFVLRGTLNDTNASLAKNYFPNKYEEFENNYNDAVARYIAQEQEKGNIVTDSEARQKTLLELGGTEVKVTGSDMPEEYRRRYYCDHDGYYPTGVFTLQEVKNTAQGEEYYLNDTPTSDFIPDSGSLYVYKLVNNGPSTYKTDEEGFLITATQFVTAIGEKAFYNTKGVDDIIVGDGINYIGDSAFENSFIKTVSFNSVFYIGNSVFKNNANLSSITLTGATTVIGKEAFYGCPKLTEIVFNNELKEIGFGAFANCQNLSLIDFSTCTEGVNIGEYAFFDCPSARDVIFAPPQSKTSIGKAAFALSTNGPTSSMTVFDFPEIITEYTSAADNTTYRDVLRDKDNATYNSPMGDYILAGRTNLITVTMPDQYVMNSQDIEVPINTFVGCENLETVTFPQNARMVSYHKELFQDVENDKFYVRGPENKSQNSPNPAMPRTSTWSASTNAAKYVPYVYTDRFGIEHYEVGNGIYRYELQINTTEDGEEDGTATLISCQFIDAAQTIDEMIVPGIVASYRVTALGDGCYSTDSLTSPAVKDYIVNLVVADDSIEEIGQSVFSNCAKLESVQLGNSVKTIGTNAFSDNKLLEEVTIGGGIESVGEKAFANCPKLTDVIWEKPISNNTQVVIADDSFTTGGEMLYFEGDIALGYGPFDYAMEDETVGKSHYINNINGTRICYRSSGPNYYYVIRDEAAGENLLIDYPHYADLPLDVRERYERRTEVVSENGMVVTLDAPLKPSALDLQLVEQTRRLVLPEAVTSIDVKSFCLSDGANNVNQGSWIYITALDEQNVSGGINISRQDLYSNDDLAVGGIPLKDTFEESGGYHSGLFSGYYVDQIPLSSTDGIDTTRFPLQTKGNDWITSIEMPGVTSIPEYAFESCESLQSIIISEACKEIAPTSFRNCNALRTVTATGDYTFDNYILYKTLADGTYQIMTCLPGRGLINQDIMDRFVNVDNDPKLADTSELEVGAFYGCAGIVGVDLSDTSIIKVPQNTFNNCTMLSEVTLPDTPDMIIEGDVFRGNGSTIKVTIPAVLSIADSAFDPVHTITNIYTKPECRFITTTYQKKDANGNTINSKTNIYVHFMDSEFTVSFLNDDNTPYEERTVKSGSATYLPDVNPTPKKEEHSGWIFDSWKYYYTDWTEYDQPGNPLQSVTTDLYAVAQFVPDPEMPYYTITFRYDDYSVFETKQVAEGNNGLLPSTNPQPKLPEHQGWNFSHWNYYDSTLGLENVTEDRNA